MKDSKYHIIRDHVARDNRVKPTCPFCEAPIERPREHQVHRLTEMPVGSCSCGAVYAFDVTGHNLGVAFSEALVFSCNMDWDLAWDLLPGEDYQEELVQNYDIESNFIIPVGTYEGRRISGALYFIRLHQELREVTTAAVQKKIERFKPVVPASEAPAGPRTKIKFTKQDVENWVRQYQLEPLLEIAGQDQRLLRFLERLLYSGDEQLRLRAADAMGQVAGIIAPGKPRVVAKALQKLFTSVSNADYGSSNWGALDAIGAIIQNVPDLFAGHMPSIFLFLSDPELRPRALRALGTVAGTNPGLLQKSWTFYTPFLADENPATRGYTAWLLGRLDPSPLGLGIPEARAGLKQITGHQHPVVIYEMGQLNHKTVGDLAREALASIDQHISLRGT